MFTSEFFAIIINHQADLVIKIEKNGFVLCHSLYYYKRTILTKLTNKNSKIKQLRSTVLLDE